MSVCVRVCVCVCRCVAVAFYAMTDGGNPMEGHSVIDSSVYRVHPAFFRRNPKSVVAIRQQLLQLKPWLSSTNTTLDFKKFDNARVCVCVCECVRS